MATATPFYVSQQRGVDTNAGTQAAPFATLGMCLNDPASKTITAGTAGAAWSANVATITTTTAHGYATGWKVLVAGVGRAGYNGTFVLTGVPTTTTFTYALTSDPGGTSGGGTSKAPVLQGGDTLNVGPGTYREQIVCGYGGQTWTPDTVGNSGLVRASNVVTVKTTAAHAISTGQKVVISGSTSGSFDGIYVVAGSVDNTHFTYNQPGAQYSDETSGNGTAALLIDVVMDPDCRYLTSDMPGICRVTRTAVTTEAQQAGKVIDFNSKLYVHFRGYSDAANIPWYVDGSNDSYSVNGSVAQTPYQQVISNVRTDGGGINSCHVSRSVTGSGKTSSGIVSCRVENSIGLVTTQDPSPFLYCSAVSCAGHGGLHQSYGTFWCGGSGRVRNAFSCIAYGGKGGFGAASNEAHSCLALACTNGFNSANIYRCYRDGSSGADSGIVGEGSIVSGGAPFADILAGPVSHLAIRNIADWAAHNYNETTPDGAQFSLSTTPKVVAITPNFCGLSRAASFYIHATDGVGNVLVELQKSGSTVRSKTIAASALTAAAWNEFDWDTGTGDRNLTQTASVWTLQITLSTGTGTSIGCSTGTTPNYRAYCTPLLLPATDIIGRWRPFKDYPDNYKCGIGPWEEPNWSLSYTAGDFNTNAPGIKVISPGEVLLDEFAALAGRTYTVKFYVKQANCNSARLPMLRLRGCGITEQVATKANDTNWEQLTVSAACTASGVMQVWGRHQDYAVATPATAYYSDGNLSSAVT